MRSSLSLARRFDGRLVPDMLSLAGRFVDMSAVVKRSAEDLWRGQLKFMERGVTDLYQCCSVSSGRCPSAVVVTVRASAKQERKLRAKQVCMMVS